MKLSSDKSFFGSSDIESPNEQEQETFPSTKPVQEVPKAKPSQSVIGGNIKFRGELIGTEDIHIEGTVEGTIIMQGHNLTIGTQGTIDANVHANNITINGSLTGDVLADELISIRDSAKVKGNLIAPRIQLDDGGKFRGSMDMVDNEQEKKDAILKFKEKLIHPDLPHRDAAKNVSASASSHSDSHTKSEKKEASGKKSTENKADN